MKLGDVETLYEDGAWRNHVEGSGTTALSFPTQDSAAEIGRREAERLQSTHIVRDKSGEITQMSEPSTPHPAHNEQPPVVAEPGPGASGTPVDESPDLLSGSEVANDELSLNEAATRDTPFRTPMGDKVTASELEDRI
jgi:hypothetical protein